MYPKIPVFFFPCLRDSDWWFLDSSGLILSTLSWVIMWKCWRRISESQFHRCGVRSRKRSGRWRWQSSVSFWCCLMSVLMRPLFLWDPLSRTWCRRTAQSVQRWNGRVFYRITADSGTMFPQTPGGHSLALFISILLILLHLDQNEMKRDAIAFTSV